MNLGMGPSRRKPVVCGRTLATVRVYHRFSEKSNYGPIFWACQYLSKSKIPFKRSDATAEGYTPRSKRNPPVPPKPKEPEKTGNPAQPDKPKEPEKPSNPDRPGK